MHELKDPCRKLVTPVAFNRTGPCRRPHESQREPAQHRRPRRHATSSQRLKDVTIRSSVTDRGVASQRLHIVDRAFPWSTNQRPLHPAVLISQGNFQMKHLLAVALKAKMAGFDNARMHGSYRHLVYFLALHLEEGCDTRQVGAVPLWWPHLLAGPI